MGLLNEMKQYFIHENTDFIDDEEAVTDFSDLADQDIDNDGEVDDSDRYLHKRLGTIAKMDEMSEDEDWPALVASDGIIQAALEYVATYGDSPAEELASELRITRKEAKDALKAIATNEISGDEEEDMAETGVVKWIAGKDYPAYGTAKKVKQISDDRVEVTFRDGNTYTFVLEPGYETWVEESVTEMSTTAAVPGYQTPFAFDDEEMKNSEVEKLGYKKAPKTNKYFNPMEGKSTYKKMMAEMYGINEAVKYDIEAAIKSIKQFNRNTGKLPNEEYLARQVVRDLGFRPTRKNVEITKDHLGASADGEDRIPEDADMVKELYPMLEAVSYRDYKKDPTSTPAQKVNKGIAEVNRMLSEMEKIVNNNLRLKQEAGVDSSHFWKTTGTRFAKINERMTRISNRLKELSK